MLLAADDEINLLAGKNTADQKSTNSSASGSIGISIGTGGFGVTLSASGARGKADGNDVTYDNTHVEAGQTLTLQSGGDTRIQGAVARAEQIQAKVGGDLEIESLQDTSNFKSSQQSIGGSVTVGVGVSGSFSASNGKVNSTYANVAEQSGLKAGDGGFQVAVKGDTDLKGAVISSTDKAVQEEKNTFQTGGALSTSDLRNTADYSGDSVGFTVGTSQANDGHFKPAGNSAGIGSDSGHASSTTQAGISGIAGNKDARTGDAETGINKIFDADKVQADINAQVLITQTFGAQASKLVGEYASKQEKQLKLAAEQETDDTKKQVLLDEAAKWDEGGIYRTLAHTAIGGLTGGAAGAVGAGAAAYSADAINKLTEGMPAGVKQAVGAAIATGIGAAVGGTAGAATAFNEDLNNRQLHAVDKKNAKYFADLAKKQGKSFTLAEIEDALRASNYKGETLTTNIEVNPNAPAGLNERSSTDPSTGKIEDKMLPGETNATRPWIVGSNGERSQNWGADGGIKLPSADLVAFIQANSKEYTWPSTAIASQPVDPHAGEAWTSEGWVKIQSTSASPTYAAWNVNNTAGSVPIAPCGAGCMNGDPVARFGLAPEDQYKVAAYDDAVQKAGDKQLLRITVTGATLFVPVSSLWGVGLLGGGVGGIISGGDQLIDYGKITDPGKVVVDTTISAAFGMTAFGVFKAGDGASSWVGKVLGAKGAGGATREPLFADGETSALPTRDAVTPGANTGAPTAPIFNSAGADRAAKFGDNWQGVSASETIQQIAGAKPVVTYTESGKTIYTNTSTGMQVVYDNAGHYFRVENPSATGPLRFTDQFGKPIPSNVPLIQPSKTTQTGVPSDVRNALTHFKDTD